LLSLDIHAGFGAGQETEPYGTETTFFPQNRTETDRPRPLWNRNNTSWLYLLIII